MKGFADMNNKACAISRKTPFMILGSVAILLLIRSFYSFSWSDESFYLTIVHRFWLGERIIADEWYTTQLSTPLLLPFYALFQWITGGNEGVYLYFRLLYWAISTATAFGILAGLKKWNTRTASLICALMYLLYSRANIGGMSYYNLTLTFVLLAVLLVYGQLCEKRSKPGQLYLMGILLALAVVNTLFLAIPYVIVALYLLLGKKFYRLRREIFLVIGGTATAAVIYLGYVFSKVSLDELLRNIPYILNEPELQSTNPLLAIPIIFARIVWRYKWTIWATTLLLFYIWNRKRNKAALSERELLGIMAADLVILVVNSVFSANMVGCINIAAVLFVFPLVYACEKWEMVDNSILGVFGTAGCSLALAFSFSSDTGLDALTISFVVLGMGAILLLFRIRRLNGSSLLYGAVLTAACVMIFQSAILRFFSVYRDAPFSQLDTQITSGPARFLCTTKEHARQYAELEAAIEEYVREDDVVFYSKWCFWSYLCSGNEYGVPSSWRMPFNRPSLEEYYDLRPNKIPTCIFVLNPVYGNFESSLIQDNEKVERPNENELEGFLWEYIQENEYEVIELECAIIYRKA